MQSATPAELLPPVWPLSLSLATTREISVDFFSSAYLDVSVRQVPFVYLCVQYTIIWLHHIGLPHSDISGSMRICRSPKLFAACRVLLRLLVPRHSPCALVSLNSLVTRLRCFFASAPLSCSLFHEFRKSVVLLLL